MFGDGSQGALNVTSGVTYLPLNTKLQYTTVNVGASGTIRPSGTTGSVLYILASESITINGTINTSNIVNYGNNTWGVTIDGQSFTSPGVATGSGGLGFGDSSGGAQSAGFGGGGGGVGINFSGTNYRGGNGGNGSTSPSGGSSISVSRSSNGTSANRRDAAGTNGGSGLALAYRSGTNYTGNTSATGGSGGQGYGGDGAAGSGSHSHTGGSGSYVWFGGGGGGAGGRAGRAGVHVVLKSPIVVINGTINTAGTNGTNGGNGGRSRSGSGWQNYWGMPGGGGGGGNAGEIQVAYNTTFTDNGTYIQTGGSGGSGGVGGTDNTTTGGSGAAGLSNGLTPTLTEPIADFTTNVTYGVRPLSVNFTNKSIGGDTYLWNFGDGTTSTAENPTKVYSSVGTYTVSLTATNDAGSVTVTKTSYITTTIEIFSRSIDGTIKFSGGAARSFIGYRVASGTIRYSGYASLTVLKDPEALQGKTYLYKVYDENGDYLTTWKKIVISDPSYTHEINTIGSTMSLELAINSDSLDTVVQPLQTEVGQTITTENDDPILVATTTRNTIGDGTAINYNNRVDVYAFYGVVEPLLTEDDEPITTEDGEVILAETGAPNGRRIFTGFISEINSRYGNTETTQIQLTSYGFDLDQYVLTDGSKTTVTMNSIDPSDIVRQAVTQFVSKSNAEQVTYTDFTDISIESTGTVVSYTFKSVTYADLLNKTLELMPSNWFYSVGLGDNTIYYSERSQTPHHKFYLGKHLEAVDLKGSIIESKNHVLFSGGEVSEGVSLYLEEKQQLSPRVRRGLSNMSDNRVTVMASARLIAENEIDNLNKINYRTTIEVVSGQYDIESIRVGQVVGFRNFGNFVDDLTMQIIGLTYSPDTVQLQLESQPVSINKRIEDIRRNLTVTENQNQPDTPS